MTRLTQKYEAEAAQNMDAYRSKLVRFSMLMHLYTAFMITLALGCIAGMIWFTIYSGRFYSGEIKLFIILLIFVAGILKSLFIIIPKPEGLSLSRAEAPELWAEVDRFVRESKAPPIQEILLDMDANAAAVQSPAWGLFGPNKSYLLLGLPLMKVLSDEELLFVIAHEFGHFSGAHGQIGGKLYRLAVRLEMLRAGGSFQGIHGHFLRWFQARFDAMSFALRRHQEYEADAMAARLTSPAHLRALLRVAVAQERCSEITEGWNQDALKGLPRPQNLILDLMNRVSEPPTMAKLEGLVRRDMTAPTSYDDSHPSWTDRMRAQHQDTASLESNCAFVARAPSQTGASRFLSRLQTPWYVAAERVCFPTVAEQWEKTTSRGSTLRTRREELESSTVPLMPDDQAELLSIRYRLDEPVEADLRNFLQSHPNNALATYLLGSVLADADDASAEQYLLQAAQLDHELAEPAVSRVAQLRSTRGDFQHDDLRDIVVTAAVKGNALEQERDAVPTRNEPYEQHDWSAANVGALRQKLEEQKIKSAYLVRRRISTGYQTILFVVHKALLTSAESSGAISQAITASCDDLPAFSVYCPYEQLGKWQKFLDSLPSGKIL